LGADGSERFKTQKSFVKRNPLVRRKVIERAKNGCERNSCDDNRAYVGFLDVHHILGVETSDRVWTCVALCPNCHRESHFSPNRDKINRDLLAYASQFKANASE
jgi:5-methylcytosine-specific restriction protein A